MPRDSSSGRSRGAHGTFSALLARGRWPGGRLGALSSYHRRFSHGSYFRRKLAPETHFIEGGGRSRPNANDKSGTRPAIGGSVMYHRGPMKTVWTLVAGLTLLLTVGAGDAAAAAQAGDAGQTSDSARAGRRSKK